MDLPLGMEPPAPVVLEGVRVGTVVSVDRAAGVVEAELEDDVVSRMVEAGVSVGSIQMVLNALS